MSNSSYFIVHDSYISHEIRDISGSHSDGYEDDWLVGYFSI